MSEFLAEAAVLIRPDTTKFRAMLLEQLNIATKGIVVPVSVVAQTAGVKAATVETKALTAVKQEQAAADALASNEAKKLAAAQKLSATAAERTAAIQTADIGTTTELSAAKARLRAAETALAATRRANEASTLTESRAQQALAASALEAAEAEVVATRAAVAKAAADTKAAAAAGVHASQEKTLARGAGSAGLTMLGIRGATLAASGSFLVGAAAVTVLRKAIRAASSEEEAMARVTKVFGAVIANELAANAKDLASSFGLSTRAALDFEGRLGNLFKNAKFTNEEAAAMSERLVKLAADMAAFANVPVEAALKAITLGLVGNSRGLRQYQVELNQARVNQEAMRLSGKTSTDQLTQMDRILARYNLLLAQTTNVNGTAADRAGSLAQQTKILSAEMENLGASVGKIVTPAVVVLAQEVNTLLEPIIKLTEFVEKWGLKAHEASKKGGALGTTLTVLGHVQKDIMGGPLVTGIDLYQVLSKTFDDNNKKTQQGASILGSIFNPALKRFGITVEEVAGAEGKFNDYLAKTLSLAHQTAIAVDRMNFRKASNQLDTINEQLTRFRIGHADDPFGEIAILNKAIAAAQRRVAAATAEAAQQGGRSPAANQKRRQAEQDLLNLIQERRAKQKEIADAAKQAADDIQAAVDEAAQMLKDAIQAADQAITDAFTVHRDQASIRMARAELTKTLADDLAASRANEASILADIATAKRSIIDQKLRADTIRALTLEYLNARKATQDLIKAQRQFAADQRQAAIDRAKTSIQLDIELAQTTGNTNAEIRAHNAMIRFLQRLQAHTKRGTNEWKKYRNEIAAEKAAIIAARKEAEDRRKEEKKQADEIAKALQEQARRFKQIEFEFLQQQKGFAANVLSNILPTSTLAGTVGGGALTIPTQPPAGAARPGQGIAAVSQTTAQAKGASATQMMTLIQVQRLMLRAILRIGTGTDHPEGTRHQVNSTTVMTHDV